MMNQFSRTQLLLGPEAMEYLSNCRVAVFGIGGVGGYAVEALARSGIKNGILVVYSHEPEPSAACHTENGREV